MASRAHWPTVKGAHNDGGLMAQEHDSNTGLIDRLNRGFAHIAGFCFDYRWFVTPAFIAVAFGLAALASGLEADASYESYFDEDDTTYVAYENYREDFGSDEVTYIGFELPGVEHGIWNVDAMAKLIALTEARGGGVRVLRLPARESRAETASGPNSPDGGFGCDAR